MARTQAGGIVLLSSGRSMNANGIGTTVHDDGSFEQGTIVWLNPNQYLYTCLRSSVAGAVGLQLVYTRVR